jgi:TetR/AcrR family transcriptional regulator, transcriptional repressor for nem operon
LLDQTQQDILHRYTVERRKMARSNVRDKLVEAALELFHTRGYNACGVLDITNAAGVPKGSFYNHFKSKELLALAVLDFYQTVARFDVLKDKSIPPIQRLRSHFESYGALHENWRFKRGCLMGNFGAEMSPQSQVMRKALKKAFDKWCDAVAEVLQEAKRREEIEARHDPASMARFLVNSWEGAVMRSKVVRNTGPFEDFFAVAFNFILKRR